MNKTFIFVALLIMISQVLSIKNKNKNKKIKNDPQGHQPRHSPTASHTPLGSSHLGSHSNIPSRSRHSGSRHSGPRPSGSRPSGSRPSGSRPSGSRQTGSAPSNAKVQFLKNKKNQKPGWGSYSSY